MHRSWDDSSPYLQGVGGDRQVVEAGDNVDAAQDAERGSVESEDAPPESTPPATDDRGKGRDGWSLLEKTLGLLTALLTLATAGLGLLARDTASERNDVQAEVDHLSNELDVTTRQRDAFSADLDSAQAQIGELEQRLAEASTTTTVDDRTGTDNSQPPAGDDIFLSDVEPLDEGHWDATVDLNVDGTLYTQGIETSRLGYCDSNVTVVEREVEYSIGRQYQRLEAVAGLSEQSAPDLPVRLEIFGDGRPLWSETLIVGQPQTVDLDVSGVLRLRLVATKEFDNTGSCQRVYAALGDPTLRA